MTVIRMFQRRDTLANWTSANPVLGDGEIGFVKDDGSFRFGDGVTHFLDLIPYVRLDHFPPGGGGGASDLADLDGHTADTGEHVRFITFASGDRPVKNIPYDTPAILAPTNLARTIRVAYVDLTWTASASATAYDVYRDGVEIGTATGTTYRDTTVIAGHAAYVYTVVARNAYGQTSPASGSVTAFVDPALNVAPTAQVTAYPAAGYYTDGKTLVRIAATDFDAQDLATVLGADAGSLQTLDDPTTAYLLPPVGSTPTVHITGTATDPVGATDSDTLALPAGGTGGVRTVRSSFLANRVNWGNSTTDNVQGPETGTLDPYYHLAGPYTFGFTVTAIADARSEGIRVMKMPGGNGLVTAVMWTADGTLLTSKTQNWVADDGGWREIHWDAPVDMAKDQTYVFGYHYPTADQNWAFTSYVWNNGQDTCVYPLLAVGSTPSFLKAGASPTFTAATGDHNPHAYYIDPMVAWDVDVPGYEAGSAYWDQFPNGFDGSMFPIIIDFADPQWLDDYAALGMNMVSVTDATPDAIAAIKATDLLWMPMLAGDNMNGPRAVADDPALRDIIRGYFLMDEPENTATSTSPATVRSWRNHGRRLDSTRPIHINLGRNVMENQGFTWQPPGISAKDVNLQYREYAALADVVSVDSYGIAHTYPYTYQGAADSHRYGIWSYPVQISRMRTEITDGRVPVWAEVETTSAYASSPTPDQVKKTVWSLLIAGAKGILYFDHRFASAAVTQDFAAMIHDPAMSAMISALNAQITALAPALLAADAGVITSAVATGTLAHAQGGLPAGVKIPVLTSSRHVGGTYYFMAQSMRDGNAGTVTITVPGFQGATLTVIGESRTVTVDGTGKFTDTFTGDYAFHLYSTTAVPTFTVPANTAAPAITTDGTPTTGETVTCSTGTWTGVPAPTFAYQWQVSTDGGTTYADIAGGTLSSFTLTGGVEGDKVRCVVTATNSQGSASANSAAITPAAPSGGGSPYPAAVLADSPAAFYRLKDWTDSSGNAHADLSPTGGISDGTSIITDPADGSKTWDGSGTAYASTPDTPDLRGGTSFSVECWVTWPGGTGAFDIMSKAGDFKLFVNGSLKFDFQVLGAAGWFGDAISTTSQTAGAKNHIVGTWDATTKLIKMYVNGALEMTQDASTWGFSPTTSGWGPLRLGFTGTGTGMAAGSIDEAAIYRGALTDAQVAAHYAAGIAA